MFWKLVFIPLAFLRKPRIWFFLIRGIFQVYRNREPYYKSNCWKTESRNPETTQPLGKIVSQECKETTLCSQFYFVEWIALNSVCILLSIYRSGRLTLVVDHFRVESFVWKRDGEIQNNFLGNLFCLLSEFLLLSRCILPLSRQWRLNVHFFLLLNHGW